MKTLYLHLAGEYLGELAVDHVRGPEIPQEVGAGRLPPAEGVVKAC